MDVFEHFCSVDKIASYSYVIPTEDHCFDEHAPHVEETCCAATEEKSEEGCCEDEIIHVHFDLDYVNEYSDFNALIVIDRAPYFEFVSIEDKVEKRKNSFKLQPNPPPLKSSERRSLHQVFIV